MAVADISRAMQAAAAAGQAGRKDEARRLWAKVLVDAPGHPAALNALGVLSLEAGEATKAADFFLAAARADPKAAALWFNHANACRLLRDEDGERESLLAGLREEPLSLMGNIRLAEWSERHDDLPGAAERWGAVLSVARDIKDAPPALRTLLDHARAFLESQSRGLSEQIDEALAEYRSPQIASRYRRAQAAIDYTLGRRAIYLNQCSGLHVPFLPADEFFDRGLVPWLAELEAQTATIREELLTELGQGDAAFSPYVELPPGAPANMWSPLDRSKAWSALHLWRDGAKDPTVCARLPKTSAIIERLPLAHLPERMPTVFFSALAPRTHIPPHTGVSNARAIVHLPLIVPEGCRFRVGGEERAWREGEAFVFDDTIEHEAWNDSDERRIVLILDIWNPHLSTDERDMLAAFYEASERNPLAPSAAQRQQMS